LSEQDEDLLDFFRNPNRRSVEVALSSVPVDEIRRSISDADARANLSVGTYSAGGATVPVDFVSTLYRTLVWNSVCSAPARR
jgi:hypothetical protein